MKIKALLILLVIVLSAFAAFAACAKKAAPPVNEWQWPERLLLSAASSTSPTYGSAVAWTTLLSKDTGMPVRIISEPDVRLQTMWVKEGRVFTNAPHQNRSMMYGLKGYARRDWGAWQSRIWMPLGVSYWTFGALGKSGIKTPYDIKPGMKVLLFTLAEEPQQMMLGLLAWAKVAPEDVTWVLTGSITQLPSMLMDGKIDIALNYVGASWLQVEASPFGLTWLPLDAKKDPEGAERFLQWYPMTGFGICTGGGVPGAEGVPMAESLAPYITSADTDPELVYRIVKWVDENYDRFKDNHPYCKAMTLDNLVKCADMWYEPIHDGAVRYLQEKGLWTAELEAKRQYNIEQMTKWVDAYQTAIEMADNKGIVVNPDNAEWQELWENYRYTQNLPLLTFFQGPGKEQPSFWRYYEEFERIKKEVFKL